VRFRDLAPVVVISGRGRREEGKKKEEAHVKNGNLPQPLGGPLGNSASEQRVEKIRER